MSNEAKPLEREDIDQLPEGTPVTVTWSGGNGPHDYVIVVDRLGYRYAATSDDPEDRLRFYNPLTDTFTGTERYHTRVWLR